MPDIATAMVPALPDDGFAGALAGRVWRPNVGGPSVVAVRLEGVFDITRSFPTMRDLCESDAPARALQAAAGERIGDVRRRSSPTRPATCATPASRGCSRRSTCRRSRRPA